MKGNTLQKQQDKMAIGYTAKRQIVNYTNALAYNLKKN